MNEFINKKEWNLTKKVLPQHADHAGVMWHGSYFNFLEEGRIDALHKVGMSYSILSKRGYEIPVISAQIKYKISFTHGETILLKSQYDFVNKIRLNCKTLFLKVNGDIGAEALIELVLVRKENDSIKLVRDFPPEIKKIFLLLEKGPKN
ncbi:acyl-CoA thioesterase [Prochlorococcus sp. MIT 0916]|uniref:acyl-CoA thioesterase n=1 Tax=Prochlorococcus sp. MIT 0916 TaxID=3082521 RepID=UPI0039B4E13F